MCWCFRRIVHFNPLPPHGGRPPFWALCQCFLRISIHSLRMEGDGRGMGTAAAASDFNPLPPHGGRLKSMEASTLRVGKFQSTPSAWRETQSIDAAATTGGYFNPLPPHGGRRHYMAMSTIEKEFQSTPSAWRETRHGERGKRWHGTFQSTPSAWRETTLSGLPHSCAAFQSTPSAWRETNVKEPNVKPQYISIHSLRMEGDSYIF